MFLVAAATALPETPVSFSLPKNSNNNDNKSSNNSNKEQHRRLSNQRVDCPGGIQFCDNPFAIMDDPTVECNEDTCAWLITLLDPGQKPAVCRNIIITGQVSDYLEPCLWWEILFGNLRPTAAPSVSLSPTAVPTISTYIYIYTYILYNTVQRSLDSQLSLYLSLFFYCSSPHQHSFLHSVPILASVTDPLTGSFLASESRSQ